MRSDISQIILITAGVVVTALFGVFLYREIFPEYKIYQEDYLQLEQFRSTYTHAPLPPFQTGIKQIVIEREDKGPPVIDRCVSCHVALQIPYFSPTKIASDLNGTIVRDDKGYPLKVPNEDYIWEKLDKKIAELKDADVLAQLTKEGESGTIKERLALAAHYESLKTAKVDDHVYDVTKVLQMHPLMGNETRPFEFHSTDDNGCISCHNGNGRGLTTEKAHGPVFDGDYEAEYEGPTPQFTEADPKNDPLFARVFNDKPGHELLFQTQPIFVGALLQAKCMNCHQTTENQLKETGFAESPLSNQKEQQIKTLMSAYLSEKQALADLLKIRKLIEELGYDKTLVTLKKQQNDYTQSALSQKQSTAQISFLQNLTGKKTTEKIDEDLLRLIGSKKLVDWFIKQYNDQGSNSIDLSLKTAQNDPEAKGSLFVKAENLNLDQDLLQHVKDSEHAYDQVLKNHKNITALTSDVNQLTQNYQRGQELFLSQACYACHRIAGMARGGVGPELTQIGTSYPWYIKQSIVWPQADLRTSTMPNMRMDHVEIQDIMTFLLAQKGTSLAVAPTDHKTNIKTWEAGKKMPWEKPITPVDMEDLRYAMKVYATEGCAACHRLQGFDSNVGFAIEKEKPTIDRLYAQQQWFKKLFPEVVHVSQYDEELPGSEIVNTIEKNSQEIDERIVSDVRQKGLLEEIDHTHPDVIEAYYSPFRFASRAKDFDFETAKNKENDPEKRQLIETQHRTWKERVHRILMMYIQTYGLGRLIGPHLNSSGVYRTDEWLMEHFHNPAAHVPRSIMPVLPFDDTKFYALTQMLDQLAIRNRNATRQIWENSGFNAAEAYTIHCAQCHGVGRQGNGAIAEWIYPIPKNLHNPDFLRNLTQEQAVNSIAHGVRGTPMAPWNEVAQDKPETIKQLSENIPVLTLEEIRYMVEWLYSDLPGSEVLKETGVPKWKYEPHDVLDELKREGSVIQSGSASQIKKDKPEKQIKKTNLPSANSPPIQTEVMPERDPDTTLPDQRTKPEKNQPTFNLVAEENLFSLFPTGKGYYAALNPLVYETTGQGKNLGVEDVFDVVPNPNDPSIKNYYIKKQYYTPYNITQGQNFFLINCAACHGNEANGTGARAEAMQDAKPRMLTNLDWIRSRDDLRLLRSIKFGVLGTSMTPWGDFSSSLQRLQLVIFIRTLSAENNKRESLEQALYKVFDTSLFRIDDSRIGISNQLIKLKNDQASTTEHLLEIERLVSIGKKPALEAVALYQQNLTLLQKSNQLENQDQLLQKIKAEVKRERDLFNSVGLAIISSAMSEDLVTQYLALIDLNRNRFSVQNGELVFKPEDDETDKKMRILRQELENQIQEKIVELEKEKLEKVSGIAKSDEATALQAELDSLNKLKAKLITDTEEAMRSMAQQAALLKAFETSK